MWHNQGVALTPPSARTPRRAPPPLDAAALERLALRYVERFATSRGKLADYLARKVRERGWDGVPVDPREVAQRMADGGAVLDRGPEDNPPVGRVAVLRDPFGHRWFVNQPLPGADGSDD